MADENSQENSQVEQKINFTNENLLDNLLNAFSGSEPDVITYEGEGCNLTKLYDTFWTQFYESPGCSGKSIKLPKPSLGNDKIKPLASIIRRGWQDERFLPTKLFEPFLRSCIFGTQSVISPEMLLDILEDEKEVEIIKKLLSGQTSNLDDESLSTLRTLCPGVEDLSSSDHVKKGCIDAVQNKLTELHVVVQQWREELQGLMETEHFIFMMEQRERCLIRETNLSQENLLEGYDDLTDLEEDLPHKLWGTFFLEWPNDKIDFYFKMLRRNIIKCGCGGFGSKHLMGNDGSDCAAYENTLRHDTVLRMIGEQLQEAKDEEDTVFSSSDDWISLTRKESEGECYAWPGELFEDQEQPPVKPHFLAYSLRLKKVFIIGVSVMWEEWYKLSPDCRQYKTKTEEYKGVVDKLKQKGFSVEFRDIEMGCRGILCRKLYNLLTQDFKMEHKDASEKMEEISRVIISLYYQNYSCPTSPRRAGLKRRYEN